MFGILPSSFILQDTADEQGSVPFAKGGYSYVYRTTFQGRCVAVKTLTAAVGTGNLQKMHKVRGPVWGRRDYSHYGSSYLLERSSDGSGFSMKTFCPLWELRRASPLFLT